MIQNAGPFSISRPMDRPTIILIGGGLESSKSLATCLHDIVVGTTMGIDQRCGWMDAPQDGYIQAEAATLDVGSPDEKSQLGRA